MSNNLILLSSDAISHDDFAAFLTGIGGGPNGCVVVEATSGHETDRLALDFCIAFTERWHAVAWDVQRWLWTLAELRRALQNGKGMGFR